MNAFDILREKIKQKYEKVNPYVEKSVIEIINEVEKDFGKDINVATNDFCEWKSAGISDEWNPSCENNSTYNVSGVAWFRKCPYCGKKIKVVGNE